MHHDNLLDILLARRQGEIISQALAACDSADLRSKFVLTLDGIGRSLEYLCNLEIADESDVENGKEFFNALAVCLLDSAENKRIFEERQGLGVMIHCIRENKFLRRDAIRVLSFALTGCETATASHFIRECACLPVLFGFLMKSPDSKSKRGEVYLAPRTEQEVLMDMEHLFTVIWNLIKALHGSEDPKHKISLERLIFKLLEAGKIRRIDELLEKYLAPVSDFDLNLFKEPEEIAALEQDYHLDLLCSTSLILTYLK